MTLFQYQYN